MVYSVIITIGNTMYTSGEMDLILKLTAAVRILFYFLFYFLYKMADFID